MKSDNSNSPAVSIGQIVPADRDPCLQPYSIEGSDAAEALDVDPALGLNEEEIAERRDRYGLNTIQSTRDHSAGRILLDQLRSLLVALLGIAAFVAMLTGEMGEAAAILVVLAINALIGFATEWQAGKALAALRRQVCVQARVRRSGREALIDAGDLVPGDVLILNAGDAVPADARLLEAADLSTQESSLTGESTTIEKSCEPVAPEAALAERTCMIFLGTQVVAGRALALVTATGSGSELGRIGRLVAEAAPDRPPLERRLDKLGQRLVYLVLAIAAAIILTGWLRGDEFWRMIEVGISLAVAAVPEGLPAVITLILALGVLRMAREKAVVRRLPAVEKLGSTTVVCADKTGTLTENRMTVREYYLADGRTIETDDRPRETSDEALECAVRVGVLCNEAVFEKEADRAARTLGDPTETALLVVADALVLSVAEMRSRYPKLDERPFHASAKRMITLHHAGELNRLIAMKGAPAVVLEACEYYATGSGEVRPIDESTRARLIAANEEMADRALRVLALAEKPLDCATDRLSDRELEQGYTFLGFVGMIDPPRPGVSQAIKLAREAGIRTIMLTGDQINTARAIARELNLSGDAEPHALHARDLAIGNPVLLAQQTKTVDVFARVTPEDKLRIVEALQNAGEIVTVTGDGVNDAPAIKRADIGVAMGLRGTEVAKEAADVVLADDNFSTIVKAVQGGRTIYANIVKFVHLMFSHNLAEVLMIFVAIAAGWPLPLLPLQILWMNLVTDVMPAFALAVEPPSPDLMRQPPRSPQKAMLSKGFLLLITWQGAMLAGLALLAYGWALNRYGAGPHARTMALLAIVGVQSGHLFNCRSRTRSAAEGLFRNRWIWIAVVVVWGLQLAAVYFPPLAEMLELVRPAPSDWLMTLGMALATVAIVEVVKALHRYVRKPGQSVKFATAR